MKNLQLNKENMVFNGVAMFRIILAAKARYRKSKLLMYEDDMVEEIYDTLLSNENTNEEARTKELDNLEEDYCELLKEEENNGLVAYDYESENYYSKIDKSYAEIALNIFSNIYGEEKVDTIKQYVIKHNK